MEACPFPKSLNRNRQYLFLAMAKFLVQLCDTYDTSTHIICLCRAAKRRFFLLAAALSGETEEEEEGTEKLNQNAITS